MIVLDTETTGLEAEDKICQLSYAKFKKVDVGAALPGVTYALEYAKNFYFKVEKMNKDAEKVHGLSLEKLEELSQGKTFEDYSDEIFRDFIGENEVLVGHNVGFDIDFLTSEFESIGVDLSSLTYSFCTMLAYTPICKIDWNNSFASYKWPKLQEVLSFLGVSDDYIRSLAKEIFGKDIEDISAHDSRFDVVATFEIYMRYLRDYSEILLR